MIAVVDAGLGNLRSVEKALAAAGGEPLVTGSPEVVARAERLVVPGQGAFGDCGKALGRGAPLGEAVLEFLAGGRPYLGICLGLQILFDTSEEDPTQPGLGVFPGAVVRIPEDQREPGSGRRMKVPHMGWNDVHAIGRAPGPLAAVLDGGATAFYFVHSYHAVPEDPRVVAAITDFGEIPLTAAVARDNVIAVQFHPEKSQRAGLDFLRAFVAWRP